MKVTVDAVACEANALCAQLVPEVFAVDEDDVLHIAAGGEVPAALAGQVRDAVSRCPKMALLLRD